MITGLYSASADSIPILSAHADTDVPGPCPGVALGHVRGSLDVPGKDVADGPVGTHGRVERVDRRSGHAEGLRHTFALKDFHGGLCRSHPGHRVLPS
jgi:hypothetical protein